MRAPIDTAVIMAGGQGMRLRPYTTVLPKPLMPIGDRSLLEILLRQLQAAGVRRVIVSVNHLAHLIRAVLDHAALDGLEIDYQYEDAPLGTCGALTLMHDRLPERFLVVNGDLLSDYPIATLLERHADSDAGLSLGTRIARQSVSFGVIRRDDDGRMSDFLKPGAYADMPDLSRLLLADGRTVQALPSDCTWIDIGHPEDYQRAQEMFEHDGARFLDGCAR